MTKKKYFCSHCMKLWVKTSFPSIYRRIYDFFSIGKEYNDIGNDCFEIVNCPACDKYVKFLDAQKALKRFEVRKQKIDKFVKERDAYLEKQK